MPSERFRLSTARHSLCQAAHSFFGSFHASTSAPSSCYPLDISVSTMGLMDDTDPSLCTERRSAHNALERQRREHLNSKFQQLAHALPSLQSVRRPSKTMIVARSLEFVSGTKQRESKYKSQILELRKENERLRKQARAQQLQQRQLKQSTSAHPSIAQRVTRISEGSVLVEEPNPRRDSSTSSSSSETTSLLLSDTCQALPLTGWSTMDGGIYGTPLQPIPEPQQQNRHHPHHPNHQQQQQQQQQQALQPQGLSPYMAAWTHMSLTDEETMIRSMMPFSSAYCMPSDQTQKDISPSFHDSPTLNFTCKSNLDPFYL